ncbi:MAG: hypothetical protein J5895_04575 [Alphaproteobacteria bacterium]|nr:hypothetical protein [Alphaproteobacteria bacterium]MBQ7659691.1 hypothetical protein [Alphaproteobacteria bacterium]
MFKRVVVLFLLLVLGACGSYYEPEPVGIGKNVNELKLSPCACMEVELEKGLPQWFAVLI